MDIDVSSGAENIEEEYESLKEMKGYIVPDGYLSEGEEGYEKEGKIFLVSCDLRRDIDVKYYVSNSEDVYVFI